MEIQGIFEKIGDYISQITAKTISWLSSFGMNVTSNTAKIISILLILIISFFTIKFIEKPIKWAIIILFAVLIVSLFYSMF